MSDTTTPAKLLTDCGARNCQNGFWNGRSKYKCYTCKGTGKVESKLTDAVLKAQIDELKSVVEHLPARSQKFAQSLIKQAERKGSLSPKQMPYLLSMTADGLKVKSTPTPAPTPKPVNEVTTTAGWEAVTTMMSATHENLQTCRLRIHTDAGQVVFKSKVSRKYIGYDKTTGRHNYENTPEPLIYVELNKTLLGTIKREESVATFNTLKGRTPTQFKRVEGDIDLFRQDPIGVMTAHGKKSGNCCFCGRDLTDHRSTAHGYGPICAKRYTLPWDKTSAMVIESDIAEKTQEAIVMFIEEGVWAVKDSESGDTLATFTNHADANRFADDYSNVEKVA